MGGNQLVAEAHVLPDIKTTNATVVGLLHYYYIKPLHLTLTPRHASHDQQMQQLWVCYTAPILTPYT